MRTATFEHSVNVLVRAYMNDTLEHTNCYACACGNLVAEANNFTYKKENCGGLIAYNGQEKANMFWFDPLLGSGKIKEMFIDHNVESECETVGYSIYEMAIIEDAFEGAEEGENKDEWIYNGLMAVVDVLAEIHGIDLTVREETKKLFVKA